MITPVHIISDNIISSLGFKSEENVEKLKGGRSGISLIDNQRLFNKPFYASAVDYDEIQSRFSSLSEVKKFTKFEKLLILSISDALKTVDIDIKNEDTLIIISTTKGNIELLHPDNDQQFDKNRVYLWKSAEVVRKHFDSPNTPIVVSNACVSGVLALIAGSKLIKTKKFKNIVVSGADILSEFIIAGFHSFKSISEEPCRPFDLNRTGLSLGEGAGSIILSSENYARKKSVIISGNATTNDANHISGPSRTGEGLYTAIENALLDANISDDSIGHISAHGTATPFNDEMEAIAFDRAGLSEIPVNSLKGFWGHTLGAAGIIESVAAIRSLKEGYIFKSVGMEKLGVSKKINVTDRSIKKTFSNCLKTSSGFGGSNAAIIFSKFED